MINLCDYGCGQEAKYQFKNGRWCCSKSKNTCPTIRDKFSKAHCGKNHHYYGKKRSLKTKTKISKSHIGKFVSIETKNKHSERLKKIWMMNDSPYRSEEYLKGLQKRTTEQWKNDELRNLMIKNIQLSSKKDLEYWKSTYPLFSKIEKMRYNPNKPGKKEIQVHCKNHNCPNSKEQGGWFTPTYVQLYERIRGIEKTENDGGYFYCSEECKNSCPLYGLRSDPFNNQELSYTQEEYNVWKNVVLEQDNYKCQKCGSKENLHCHHIIPVKLEPMFALDPENGIVFCEKCHYEFGHKTGTECSTGNLAQQVCLPKKGITYD